MNLIAVGVNIWIILLAALVAIFALIAFSIAFRKRENNAATIGIILIAITVALLIIGLFYDLAKEPSSTKEKEPKETSYLNSGYLGR